MPQGQNPLHHLIIAGDRIVELPEIIESLPMRPRLIKHLPGVCVEDGEPTRTEDRCCGNRIVRRVHPPLARRQRIPKKSAVDASAVWRLVGPGRLTP